MQFHPDIDKLQKALPALAGKDKDFATDLIEGKWGYQKTGKLSEKQWYWVKKLAEKAETQTSAFGKATCEVVPGVGRTEKLMALFNAPAGKLKSPAITMGGLLQHEGKTYDLKFYKGGVASKYPGAINCIALKAYLGGDRFVARIMLDGEIHLPAWIKASDATMTALVTNLKAFAKEPQGFVASYGKLIGRCCFCNKGLDDPKSVTRGYGPTCAKKWGLPWG